MKTEKTERKLKTVKEVKTTEVHNLFDRAIALSIDLGRFGMRKSMTQEESDEVKVDADKKYLHMSKDIFRSKRFNAIRGLDNAIKLYVYVHVVPSPLKNGVYMIAHEAVIDVSKRLDAFAEERKAMVAEFIEEYKVEYANVQKNKARPELRVLFNAGDYPPVKEVEASFTMEYRFLEFRTAGKLQAISRALYERELEKAKVEVERATADIKFLLRSSFLKMLNELTDKLRPKDDGTKRTFRDSLTDKVKEFLENFNARNIVADAELHALVERAKKVVDGLSLEQLRENDTFRAQVTQRFDEMTKQLDGMLVEKSRRIKVTES